MGGHGGVVAYYPGMAGKQFVEVERVFDHPIDQVFARYTNHDGWSRWAGFGKINVAREGSTERFGVGSVRAFARVPGLREEVVRFEPPHLQAYQVTAGAVPFTDHLGEVMFEEEGARTRVRWRVQFRPMVPGTGWVLSQGLRVLFRRVLARLARDLDAVR